VPLKRDNMTLNDYDVRTADTLYVQDRGVQVSYRLSQILINVGPIITFTLFWSYSQEIYAFCLNQENTEVSEKLKRPFEPRLSQSLAFWMAILHFTKRVVESVFIHFYSKPSKSLNVIMKEVGYFWLFFGILVPFYLLHPLYREAPFLTKFFDAGAHLAFYVNWAFFGVFLFAELMNLLCHLHLRSFRKADHDFTRQVPRFHGFSVVACANYFWEFIAWIAFFCVTQTLLSGLFLALSFFRMNHRAHRKHHRYIAQFKKQYPAEQRYYFIPYLF